MQNEIKISVNLQVDLRLDVDTWVGVCPSLDLASQGESEQLALKAITEAVEVWFESCLERGVLAQALEESGFQRVMHKEALPDGVNVVEISLAQGLPAPYCFTWHSRPPWRLSLPQSTCQRSIRCRPSPEEL